MSFATSFSADSLHAAPAQASSATALYLYFNSLFAPLNFFSGVNGTLGRYAWALDSCVCVCVHIMMSLYVIKLMCHFKLPHQADFWEG